MIACLLNSTFIELNKRRRRAILTSALKGPGDDEFELAQMLMRAKLIVQTREHDVDGNKPEYD